MEPSTERPFIKSKRKELQGLEQLGVFEKVPVSKVDPNSHIYSLRWVHGLKRNDDCSEFEKSRVVGKNFRDKKAVHLPTRSPTVLRMVQRLSLFVASMNGNAYLRDIIQSYVQSMTKLERPIYYYPLPEMNLPEDTILMAKKPLYGLPEAGLHWFITYSQHHIENLRMTQSSGDTCLFYRMSNSVNPNLVILQVDDSFGTASDPQFLKEEEEKSALFQAKPRKEFYVGSQFDFNGSKISRISSNSFSISQKDKIDNLGTSRLSLRK